MRHQLKYGWIILVAQQFFSCTPSYAEISPSDFEYLADAIFKAEGIHSRHPYGILKKYKHTTPRQACLNTISHAYQDWSKTRHKPFLEYLANRYAPIGSSNDTSGLNKNWLPNVETILKGGSK